MTKERMYMPAPGGQREKPKAHVPEHEIDFDTMRSGGSGGQSVNTTDSAVRGVWNVDKFFTGSAEERARAIAFLKKNHPKHLKENEAGEVLLVAKSQTQKSQLQNKSHVIEKLNELMTAALEIREERIEAVPTRVKAVIDRRRLNDKTRAGQQKRLRRDLGE